MKKIILVFLASLIVSLAGASDQLDVAISDYRSALDGYINDIISENYEADDAVVLWHIMDRFTLSVLNGTVGDKNLFEALNPYNNKIVDGIRLSQEKKSAGASVGFVYQFVRPPENIEQNFGISIMPLISNEARPYFVIDWALWYESPFPEKQRSSQPLYVRTFRIVDRNKKTGLYEITAKQENTNFFKQIVIPGKIKHGSYNKPWYIWGGDLDPSSVKFTDSSIRFNVWYSLCYPAQACYHDITVSYLYRNGKLSATKYREHDGQHYYDTKAGKYKPRDITVNLAP